MKSVIQILALIGGLLFVFNAQSVIFFGWPSRSECLAAVDPRDSADLAALRERLCTAGVPGGATVQAP